MEIKKSAEADLENDKSGFVLMGLLVALCAIFIAFEISQRDITAAKKNEVPQEQDIEEEVAPPSEQNTPPPPPPPPPAPEPVIQEAPTEFKVDKNAHEADLSHLNDDDGDIKDQTPQVLNKKVDPVEPEDNDNQVYVKVQKKAEYPGGNAALSAFLSKNIVYPRSAAETGTQGKVIVEFVIEKNGTVSDVKVARSIDPALDKEAMRVVKLMKNWTPAQNGSKNVRCKFRLPVDFRLQ